MTKIVRPDHQRQNPAPKIKVEDSDGEHPADEPQAAAHRVLLNFYFLHTLLMIHCTNEDVEEGAAVLSKKE